ncbi:MAG: CoA pyrophosphatase [Gammaproteobacteria bacterium]|nr:CoA pyrophosphatase [Gammaproteobacteria bacterium]
MDLELINNALPDLCKPVATPDFSDALKASAVLILLHQEDSQWQLLFTKRASHLKSHAGQISFPGGRFEQQDTHLMNTAVRETEEEIGLARKYIKVISQLNEHPTLTGFRIFPYIGVINQLPKLSIDTGEVEEIFSVPLLYLIDPQNHQEESAYYQGKSHLFYKIIWEDKFIWGATARMIVELSRHIAGTALNDDVDSHP